MQRTSCIPRRPVSHHGHRERAASSIRACSRTGDEKAMNIRTANIPPEGITTDEFLGRVAKVRSALDKAGLVGLLAFGDCWRGANISYFTEFRPLDGVSDIANAILLLSVDGDPVLFVSDQCFDYATSVTAFEVRSLREVTQQVQAFSARHGSGTVGLAGAAYIPA